MCGRIGLPQLTWREFVAWQRGEFSWDDYYRERGAVPPGVRWNVPPSLPIEMLIPDGTRLCSTVARWGLIPDRFKGKIEDFGYTHSNTRIETADQKPTFRDAWLSSRCVVPVSGYFEWSGQKGSKQPWWISVQSNAPCMYFAGLCTQRDDGQRTATVLTRDALPQISHIHHRTPVIITHDQIWPWVTHQIGTTEAKNSLGTGWDGRMNFHMVRPFHREDGPELIEPMDLLI